LTDFLTDQVYGKFDGTSLKIDKEDHQMIKADNVLFTVSGLGGDELTAEQVHCTRDRVLVEVAQGEETTAAGIIVAVSGNEKQPSEGQVVNVGPGAQASNGQYLPMPVAIGDKVKFREYAGMEMKLGGKRYVIVSATDLLAKY
jgi:chaperonin GroES